MSYDNQTLFINAVNYIYEHMDESLELNDIAKAIGTSASTLKRAFHAMIQTSPGGFIRKLRMECAFRVLKNRNDSILEIALQVGFDDHAAFSRAFKDLFGYTPTAAREKWNIMNELECVTLEEPEIIETKSFTIQCVTETGTYFDAAPRAWAALNERLASIEGEERHSGIYVGIGHDNPHDGDVPAHQVRFTAGVALVRRELNIPTRVVAGGSYGRFHYRGKLNNLGLAYHYIYGKWNEAHNHRILSTQPAWISLEEFPDPLKEQRVMIYVPLK